MIQIRDSYLKHIICSCILLLISVYSSASEVIRTSSILKWTPSSLSKIVEWCQDLIAANGEFICMKANLEEDELRSLQDFAKIEETIELKVPSLDEKRQAVILKLHTTL